MTLRERKAHDNQEPTVRCPVEGCGAEKLARGMHLHVRQSAGNGHGARGTVPDHLDLDNLESVGAREVTVRYPTERDNESVARQCPYCERAFSGKHGVMIHLGQVAGRKNHPEDAVERHEADDFAIVRLDDQANVTEIVEGAGESVASPEDGTVDVTRVYRYLARLLSEGHSEEARRARAMLLEQ